MAKRFFDNNKFDNPFYRKLKPEFKCAYEYLISKCDYAGVLNLDIDDMNFKISCEVGHHLLTFEQIKEIFSNKLLILDEQSNNGKISKLKIFLPRFIYWQYKNELTPNNSVHRCVYNIFKQEGISISPFLAPGVVPEYFENWGDIYRTLKDRNMKFKEFIEEENNERHQNENKRV